MNPIAKKLLSSSLGGAAPGALIGAAVSDEDNRLRNALIGAGLGGTAGAGIYSAKRLSDIDSFNRAVNQADLDNLGLLETGIRDLEDVRGQFSTRNWAGDTNAVPLRIGGKARLPGTDPVAAPKGYEPYYTTYIHEKLKPSTEGLPLTVFNMDDPPPLNRPRGDVHVQFNPNDSRTYFYVGDDTGRTADSIIGKRIKDNLEFNLPGDARGLAKNIDEDVLDSIMTRLSKDREDLEIGGWSNDKDEFLRRYTNDRDAVSPDELKALFQGKKGLEGRALVDLSPKLNPKQYSTFFQDGSIPNYAGEIPIVVRDSYQEPAHIMGRLEKRSSLKLRGKARLKQALLNHAAANRHL